MPIADFQRVLAAEMVSNFGSMLSRLVVPWLATLALSATPFEMGLLLMADVVAGACGALLLGAVVDRMRKRAVMLAADAARASLLGLLAWLAATHHLPLWVLVLAGMARGLLTVMFDLARSAWVAQGIDAAHLPTRNAQMSAGSEPGRDRCFCARRLALPVARRGARPTDRCGELLGVGALPARRTGDVGSRACVATAAGAAVGLAHRRRRRHDRARCGADPADTRRPRSAGRAWRESGGDELHDLRRARPRLRDRACWASSSPLAVSVPCLVPPWRRV